MIGRYVAPKIRKENIKIFWFLVDKWFRILEFSLILGALGYFKERTNNIPVTILYWISWVVFYMWIDEIGEYVGDLIDKKEKRKWSTDVLTASIVIFLYLLITQTVELVVTK